MDIYNNDSGIVLAMVLFVRLIEGSGGILGYRSGLVRQGCEGMAEMEKEGCSTGNWQGYKKRGIFLSLFTLGPAYKYR